MDVADIFIAHISLFEQYINYVKDYKPCTHAIKTYRERFPKYKEWLDNKKFATDTQGQDMASLMVMVIQRIPRTNKFRLTKI